MMSDVAWDSEDYVPPPPPRVITDKWDGEDEEEQVKESWEDDDEKKDSESADTSILVAKKKKKKLADIIAEKERKKQEELERRQKAKEEEKKAQSPEEILAEKLRIQKIQEDSDLQLASDLVGDKQDADASLDSFDLSTSSGLNGFRLSLLKKLKSLDRLDKKPFYVNFLEDLSRDLCENLEAESIKRITAILNAIYNEKVKANKPSKGKKKAASKAKLNRGLGEAGAEADINNYTYGYDEYDDFI